MTYFQPDRCRKYCSIVGAHLVTAPLSFLWLYGNLSAYMDSYFQFGCYPDCLDGDSQWILCLCIVAHCPGSLLTKHLAGRVGLKLTGVVAAIFTNAGLFGTVWTVQRSVAGMTVLMGVVMGLGQGVASVVAFQYVEGWAPDHASLLIGTAIAAPTLLSMVQNQIITAIVNPANLKPDARRGARTFFSQRDVLDRVPVALLTYAAMTCGLQFVGYVLLAPNVRPARPAQSVDALAKDVTLQSQAPVKDVTLQSDNSAKDVTAQSDVQPKDVALLSDGKNGTPEDVSYQRVLEISEVSEMTEIQKIGTSYLGSGLKSTSDSKTCHKSDNKVLPLVSPTRISKTRTGSDKRNADLNNKFVKETSNQHSVKAPFFQAYKEDRLSYESNSTLHGPVRHEDQKLQTKSPIVAKVNTIDEKCFGSTETENKPVSPSLSQQDWGSHSTCDSNKLHSKPSHKPDDNVLSAHSLAVREETATNLTDAVANTTKSLSPTETLKSPSFYAIFLSGLSTEYALILKANYYKQFALLYIPDDRFLTLVGTLIPVLAAASRLVLGACLNRRRVSIQAVCVGSLAVNSVLCAWWYSAARLDAHLYALLILLLALVQSVYYIIFPVAALHMFGPAHFSTNYGLLLFSFIPGGLLSPVVIPPLLHSLGWFWLFGSASILCLLALVVVVLTDFDAPQADK